MEACIDEGFGNRKMRVVWRANGDNVDFVGAGQFAGHHRFVIGIGTVGRDIVFCRELMAAIGVHIKRASDEFVMVIKAGCEAMDAANIGAKAAADHAEPELTVGCSAHE